MHPRDTFDVLRSRRSLRPLPVVPLPPAALLLGFMAVSICGSKMPSVIRRALQASACTQACNRTSSTTATAITITITYNNLCYGLLLLLLLPPPLLLIIIIIIFAAETAAHIIYLSHLSHCCPVIIIS